MFEAFSINTIYHGISFISLPVIFIALLVGWKSINTRCLLILLAALELIATIIAEFALDWRNYYYLWIFLNSLLYIYVVLARRLIIARLQKRSRLFKDVLDNFYFTKQEGALLFIYLSCSVITFIALVEVSLYVIYAINSFPFIKYFFSPLLTLLCLLEAIVILWLATRTVPVDEDVLTIKNNRKCALTSQKRQNSSSGK
ncbi:hypothetical protein [Pseudoalteromonas luteoviolacea]|uniref:Uncharacterized protein n=1 Tax=Pseudoalteromonas luteoviolacea S4054 TaxID=1129367 RepID=A0A0F6A7Z3_9GAMM|nr:hypothetical protein [Pseudoalteromonas luteoviolacea]AOT07837.1 hypothetical protein S4054249_08275 [Pseudoalteromonas luteoviolacea]AOT12753.1 hypothetical protein S40542_08275 [Pseudoalteromonas luteoviolacea]AOT17666.1 hypothetical protein S4054_08270 [Pseudoalteromonas luteoviolacea]KKE82327.1 hypothetical protein N479_18990 [Pseudoalteromonas luteoviolacea S4054]KZN78979.1 hypothetical protein N481_00620 [Pseudoalteromonas luteoviolacea S4047-1]